MAKKSTGAFDFSHFQSVTKDFLMFNKIMALVKNGEILLKCGEKKTVNIVALIFPVFLWKVANEKMYKLQIKNPSHSDNR